MANSITVRGPTGDCVTIAEGETVIIPFVFPRTIRENITVDFAWKNDGGMLAIADEPIMRYSEEYNRHLVSES